jgi:methylglutaconyl-CoA hydratase
MPTELVLYEVRQQTAILTLNRPDRRNALSHDMIAALHDAVNRAADDGGVRSVILTGAGPAFCSGLDLAELQESLGAHREPSPVWDDAILLANLYDRIYRLPKPTVAAINGPALAGGAGLVTVCDLAVSVPDARLGYPGVRRGLVAALLMPHLLRHVGERAARYLLLTGESISGEEAKAIGLVNDVAEPKRLLDKALGWTRSLSEGGPNAQSSTKELLHQFSRQSQSVEEVASERAALPLTEESRQGLQAFFAKRPAPWASR